MAEDVGWTYDEYMKCPELANRLHSRILDLEGELEQLREALDKPLLTRRRVDTLRRGEIVQSYSKWEQTWGDPVRHEVLDNDYVPNDSFNRRLITWRGLRDNKTFQTREQRETIVDVVCLDALEEKDG